MAAVMLADGSITQSSGDDGSLNRSISPLLQLSKKMGPAGKISG
jgi:hypothetical protein